MCRLCLVLLFTACASPSESAPDTGPVGAVDGSVVDAPVGRADAGPRREGAGLPPRSTELGCGEDGWCWESRQPRAYALRAIWGSAPDDVWAAGDAGEMLHYDGATWSPVATPTLRALYAIWGSARDDVWAVGSAGATIHWDGARWSAIPSEHAFDLEGIWGSASDDVWATGFGGMIHWDGVRWSPVTSADRSTTHGLAIWGTARDDVWTVGALGVIGHYDGTAWTEIADRPELPHRLEGVWGTGPDDLYVVGYAGGDDCAAGSGEGPWSYTMTYHWDGTRWDRVGYWCGPYANQLASVHGTASGDLFAVGSAGVIVQRTADRWDGRSIDPSMLLTSVWAAAADDAWAVSVDGAILHFDGTSWAVDAPPAPASDLRDVWGSALDAAWAVGSDGTIARWDGRTWEAVPSGTDRTLESVWGAAPDDVWAVGHAGTILRFDGATWASIESGTDRALYAVWADARGAWIAGETGTLLFASDGELRDHSADTRLDLRAVWGSSTTDVHAGGWSPEGSDIGSGAVFHWNGSAWGPSRGGGAASSIAGTGPDDVWFGWRWSPTHLGAGGTAIMISAVLGSSVVWASAPDEAWFYGSPGLGPAVLTHARGPLDPAPTTSEMPSGLASLWGIGGELWAVGARGAILHRR
jgi:hypothetical protein